MNMSDDDLELVYLTLDNMLTPFLENIELYQASDVYELIIASIVSSITVALVNGWAKDCTDSDGHYDIAFDAMMNTITMKVAEEHLRIKTKRGMH